MRMEPNSKLVIGAKLSILLLWLLLSEFVQSQLSLPPEEEKVLQTFKRMVDKLAICPLVYEMSSSPCHVGIYCINTDCHIVEISLPNKGLGGKIPAEVGDLKHLRILDLTNNQLSGPLPPELGSLESIRYLQLSDNQLSGPLPPKLGSLAFIRYLDLSNNQLSGPLPPELGSLASIRNLYLNNNNFTDELPSNYSGLKSLESFSAAGNHLSGPFPKFIDKWTSIQNLALEGNRFQGPIPPKIFNWLNIRYLKISDVENSTPSLPEDMNMPNILNLVLRNCSINGRIPTKLGKNLKSLKYLDMSFNNLSGDIPESLNTPNLSYLSFAKNMLNGRVPAWIGDKAAKSVQIDLSFNYFSEVGSFSSNQTKEFDLNLFDCCNTTNAKNPSINLNGLMKTNCPKGKQKKNSLFINCGGEKEKEYGNWYENDSSTSPYYTSPNRDWAYTSSGYAYHDRIKSTKCEISRPLYGNARFSPVYLKYYGFCLHEGNYTVTLYFAEIVYIKDNDEFEYISSKNRMFDIYVQGNKTITDFNIKAEAEARKEKVTQLNITAHVNDTGVLEIEFYWAGRGPSKWVPPYYSGPLVSAISAVRDFSESKLKYIVLTAAGGSIVLLIGLSLVWRFYLLHKRNSHEIKIGEGKVKLRDIKRATRGFSQRTMIGKGNFGTVHKATLKLKDNSEITVAVKKLNQFSNEVPNQLRDEIYKSNMLSHENIVQLFDVYIGKDLSFVVFEHMDNKSLQDVLFDPKTKMKNLDWNKRAKICKGIAKALKYLHERQAMKMIHTGLKASNILLDRGFNAKLSDIGLASLCAKNDNNEQFKLFVEDVKFGYAAPEYASRNKVSFASDVFTFGVLVLEIVSGKRNSDGHRFSSYDQQPEFLTEKVCTARNILELVDESLITIDQTEARKILMLAKLCVNMDQEKRPTISQIVGCLNNEITIDDIYKSIPQGDAATTETFKTTSSDAHFTTIVASGSTSTS